MFSEFVILFHIYFFYSFLISFVKMSWFSSCLIIFLFFFLFFFSNFLNTFRYFLYLTVFESDFANSNAVNTNKLTCCLSEWKTCLLQNIFQREFHLSESNHLPFFSFPKSLTRNCVKVSLFLFFFADLK